MRLLWLGHFLPYPPQGGNLQRSYHLLREAAGRHEVTWNTSGVPSGVYFVRLRAGAVTLTKTVVKLQ